MNNKYQKLFKDKNETKIYEFLKCEILASIKGSRSNSGNNINVPQSLSAIGEAGRLLHTGSHILKLDCRSWTTESPETRDAGGIKGT